MLFSELQIHRVQACNPAGATAPAAGVAPGRTELRNRPAGRFGDRFGITFGDTFGTMFRDTFGTMFRDTFGDTSMNRPSDRSRGVPRDEKATAVAQWYTPGGIRRDIRSLFGISPGEKRNF